MNCRNVARVLNDAQYPALDARERRELDAHLSRCAACSDEWTVQELMRHMSIPPRSEDLLARVCTSVAQVQPAQRRFGRARRSIVAGSLMIGAVAVAGVYVFRASEFYGPSRMSLLDSAAGAAEIVEAPSAAPRLTVGRGQGATVESAVEASAARREAVPDRDDTASGDAFSFAVLPIETSVEDPEWWAAAETLRDKQVRLLEEAGLREHDRSAVSSYAQAGLSATEIGRQLGVGVVLILDDGETGGHGIDLHLLDPGSQLRLSALQTMFPWPEEVEEDLNRSLSRIAERLGQRAYRHSAPMYDRQVVSAETAAQVMNGMLDDEVRVDALERLGSSARVNLETAVVAAAIELVTTSDDPSIRRRVWMQLSGMDDPYLVRPLLDALAFDPDDNVRRIAAVALTEFAEQSVVTQELAAAEERDGSLWVREAAGAAKSGDDGWRALNRRTFLDVGLPEVQRVTALNPIGAKGFYGPAPDIDNEITVELIDLGTHGSTVGVRATAVQLLRDAESSSVVEPLLEFLNDSAAEIRGAATSALSGFTDEPGVRQALEYVAEHDPSISVQSAARLVLTRSDRAE